MTEISGVHITRWGHTGTKLVLIHGGVQGTKESGTAHFLAQERLAERGYEVLVPDRPGHGRSPAPNRPDDAEADGQWVAELWVTARTWLVTPLAAALRWLQHRDAPPR